MTRDLHTILRSGYCTRWHANPDLAHIRETMAEHHARVAQIILAMHPAPSLALVDAALHHDAGEMIVGDLPWPFKVENPKLAKMHKKAEKRALRAMGLRFKLTKREARWLRFADRMAAYRHVEQVAPHLLRRGEWIDAWKWIKKEDKELAE